MAGSALEAMTRPAMPLSIADQRGLAITIYNSNLGLVRDTRRIGKRDMVRNDARPRIEVDPETYEVRADGELLDCEPAKVLPLAQRYFLF